MQLLIYNSCCVEQIAALLAQLGDPHTQHVGVSKLTASVEVSALSSRSTATVY
jgi:hypothetical protein